MKAKYLVKKVIKNTPYFYLQYGKYSRNLGTTLPPYLKHIYLEFFDNIALQEVQKLDENITKQFPFVKLDRLEQMHYWYLCIANNELFAAEHRKLVDYLSIIFTFNSNRSEGSKITRKDLENAWNKELKRPRTSIEQEAINSRNAIRFTFSKEFRFNRKCLKLLHRKLLEGLESPLMVGKWKKVQNTAPGNQQTSSPELVNRKLRQLFVWLQKSMKKRHYPPLLALEFYCRFEQIHPFEDGNGRVGRLLLNAILHKQKYLPVIFFTANHKAHCEAIRQFLAGRKRKLCLHFLDQADKTYSKCKSWTTPTRRKQAANRGAAD